MRRVAKSLIKSDKTGAKSRLKRKSRGRHSKQLELIGRPERVGPFVCQRFEPGKIGSANKVLKYLVLSIPGSCGIAVKRNLLRRRFKALLYPSLKERLARGALTEGLWVRLRRENSVSRILEHKDFQDWISKFQAYIQSL